uniref:Uncharacterized protein n=1 Tax=Lygus hesperus TaxID=30085 RepID=A0A0A9YJZ4_LYGHE
MPTCSECLLMNKHERRRIELLDRLFRTQCFAVPLFTPLSNPPTTPSTPQRPKPNIPLHKFSRTFGMARSPSVGQPSSPSKQLRHPASYYCDLHSDDCDSGAEEMEELRVASSNQA